MNMRDAGRRTLAVVVALAAALTLGGCSASDVLGTVGSALHTAGSAVVSFVEGLDLGPTSVAEAKAEAGSDVAPAVSSPTIHEDGTLVVGLQTATSTAPFCHVDGDTVQGLDVDVARVIASQMGLEVRFVAVSDVQGALESQCDIVMNTRTGENPDDVTVVGSYVQSAMSFFHRGEETTVSTTDLTGKAVAVQAGSESALKVEDLNLGMATAEYSNVNECFEALEAGEVDYVVCDSCAGAFLSTQYEDIAFCGAIEQPTAVGIAVLTSNSNLQSAVSQALTQVDSNGMLALASSEWIGDLPTITDDEVIAGA